MKKNVLIAISLFCMTWSTAFSGENLKTVVMKPSYSDQVYVSLSNGVVKNTPLADWDLGFEIKNISSSILVNEGKGAELYYVPNSSESTFAETLKPEDLSTWERIINSTTDWSMGAFNRGFDYNTGNFGWGEYNMGSHTIVGNSVFVVKFLDNSMKKMFITNLAAGKYMFKYANLDGTEEVSGEVNKADFSGRNFGYYSFAAKKSVDIEPASTTWDIVFGKYADYTKDMSGNTVPYVVAGIRSNFQTYVAKIANGANQSSAPEETAYSAEINTIGYTWKTFAGTAWTIDKTTAYFVKTQENKIFKLVFQDFGGSATGSTTYSQDEILTSSIYDNAGNITGAFSLYPNIVTSSESVSIVLGNESAEMVKVTVQNTLGDILYTQVLENANGLQTLNIPQLSGGMYLVTVGNENFSSTQKLLITK